MAIYRNTLATARSGDLKKSAELLSHMLRKRSLLTNTLNLAPYWALRSLYRNNSLADIKDILGEKVFMLPQMSENYAAFFFSTAERLDEILP